MTNLREALEHLKKLLPQARRKAARAKEVTRLDGYSDFRKWAFHASLIGKPNFANFNKDAFLAECLFKAGIAHASTYFEAVQLDHKQVKEQRERIEKELQEELDPDIDDDE
jgi:hypothetical protein